jgi:hypothetical protein
MKDEHFIKVMCSQELPKEIGQYITDMGECKFDQEFNCFLELGTFEVTQCNFWLKPIDLEQVKAENNQLKFEISEWNLYAKATNEAIEGKNLFIHKLQAENERLKELG